MKSIWVDTIINKWINENIKLNLPAAPESIKAAEEIINFRFPDDFKEFYLKLDGFTDWDWTKNMFSIWPLARTLEEYHNESDKNFIVFADYLINAHHIGFVKGKKGVFKNCGEIPELIADTFSEAVFHIISDADILY
ncbi:SMI1/KNR4 family protein (plasmid) [Chryseobacterium panacisoli]|uniref:SMI1/KNR4 family protein n=1 Tax=Chryseobacterium panacisoli TaxID=1807141 RepID=A0A5D8ZZZ3_9FLAO|nr:SMI1/KNR4 family protein [Chryseobacterium panacisoli]TZG00108.1 SMI1/KNR4 family protein [Chryseobacterium panacisoli]